MLQFLKKLTADEKGKQLDFPFLFTLIILLGIGLLALSSASSYYALTEYGNSTYYLIRQMLFAVLGVIVMIIVSKIDYKVYKNWSYLFFLIAIGLMLLVFVPGLGTTVKGARRWLNLGLFTFQPSEVMKLGLILAISKYIVDNIKKMGSIKGYILPVLATGIVCVLMYFQSHLSGAIVMCVIAFAIILES